MQAYTYVYIPIYTHMPPQKNVQNLKNPYGVKATSVQKSTLLSYVGMVNTFMKGLKVKLLMWSFLALHLFKQDGLNLKEI